MLAAIPFFQLSTQYVPLPFGLPQLPIDPWMTLVCVGVVVGLEVARWRGLKLGLDPRDVVDASVAIVITAFVVAHVFTIVAYFPERFSEYGLAALWQTGGFSSTGGFIGAVIGAFAFFRYFRPHVSALRHADVIMFGFPFGWFFGRLGCASVHDHIGKETSFFLAMDFDHGFGPWADGASYVSGIRHELGLYEALYMIAVDAAFCDAEIKKTLREKVRKSWINT